MMNTQDFTPAETTETAAPRSLGYWLRMTDALMSREVARGFRSERATRRDLRILNALAGDAELTDRLRERLARGGSRVADLADRGWIARGEDSWEITPEGEAARARLAAVVAGVRQRTEQAVSAEDLATTRATLEALAREFGWTEDTRLPRAGRRHPWSGRGHRGHGHGRGFEHGRGFGHDAARGAGHEHGRGFGHGHQGRTPDCAHDSSREHGHGAADSRGCDRGHGGGYGRGHERGHGGYGSNGSVPGITRMSAGSPRDSTPHTASPTRVRLGGDDAASRAASPPDATPSEGAGAARERRTSPSRFPRRQSCPHRRPQ